MFEVIALFLLHETYIPTLLKWKVSKAKEEDPSREWYSVLEIGDKDAGKLSPSALALDASRPGAYCPCSFVRDGRHS